MAYQSDNALEIEGLTNKEIDHAIFYNPNSGRPDHRRILRCGDRRSDFIRPIFSVISLLVSAISLADAPGLMKKNCVKRGRSPLRSSAIRPGRWGPMP